MRTSPLFATALVLAGIGLFAVPLRRLTQATAAEAAAMAHAPVGAHPAGSATPAVLRLRLLAPARSLKISLGDGTMIWSGGNFPAGEAEHDVSLPAFAGLLDLNVAVELDGQAGDSAVFLTVMPDGMEEKTLYAIGSSPIEAPLHFSWP